MTTELATETKVEFVEWKGQPCDLTHMPVEALDGLTEDILYANAILEHRLDRGNLTKAEYDKILASNNEVLDAVNAEIADRGWRICAECHVKLIQTPDEICRRCWEEYQFADKAV